jgi:predicted RNA binding protein YcfA (HicA-like mRNA interferase family)
LLFDYENDQWKSDVQTPRRKGWKLARITGSHHIYLTEGRNVRITIPVHGNQDLKTGLQKFIMKLANIGEEEL